MASDVHRSIGEVLALLREEFPDITISKIRFLESQGLVDPERTPSGYRRFFDTDIERLRWILRQQRENYLPLKVIKDRLDDADGLDGPTTLDSANPAPSEDERPRDSGVAHLLNLTAEPAELEEHIEAPPAKAQPRPSSANPTAAATSPPGPAVPATPVASPRAVDPPTRAFPEPSLFAGRGAPADANPTRSDPAVSATRDDAVASGSGTSSGPVAWHGGREDLTSVSLTAQELADTTGLRLADVAELEKFGLLEHTRAGSVNIYDDEALIVARLSAAFRAQGIDFRHLRMFKVAADREAALFEQVVTPLARKRTPEARRELNDTITDLARLTDSLHSVLLHAALRTLG